MHLRKVTDFTQCVFVVGEIRNYAFQSVFLPNKQIIEEEKDYVKNIIFFLANL